MNDACCAFCDIRFLIGTVRPFISFPLPVSVNRAAPDLATSDTKEKQLQKRKLNIPADALDCGCVSMCEVCRPLQAV